MTAPERKSAIFAKKHAFNARRLRRDQLAIEKKVASLYEIQRSAHTLALESPPRYRESVFLVSQALERIENDTYGMCVECDRPISERRLAAIPWARYCIPCQEVADRSNL